MRARVSWEMVLPFADGGRFYRGDDPACHPAQVPDEFWTKSSREVEVNPSAERLGDDPAGDGLLDQAVTLRRWAETGEQLIRNVKLEQCPDPVWVEVPVP
jgi:hypothetical protein